MNRITQDIKYKQSIVEYSFKQFSDKIMDRAYELGQYNIKNMDSLHIAYAESSNIDYFITTDRLLINAANSANLKVKVINPINFVMEVI